MVDVHVRSKSVTIYGTYCVKSKSNFKKDHSFACSNSSNCKGSEIEREAVVPFSLSRGFLFIGFIILLTIFHILILSFPNPYRWVLLETS